MFKQVNSLPRPEDRCAVHHGNGKAAIGQGGPDVRRHIVRPFTGMPIKRRILTNQPTKKCNEIVLNVRIGVFLDGKGRAGVSAEYRQQAGSDLQAGDPAAYLFRDLVEPLATGRYMKSVVRLFCHR